jgi:hypothetical protein
MICPSEMRPSTIYRSYRVNSAVTIVPQINKKERFNGVKISPGKKATVENRSRNISSSSMWRWGRVGRIIPSSMRCWNQGRFQETCLMNLISGITVLKIGWLAWRRRCQRRRETITTGIRTMGFHDDDGMKGWMDDSLSELDGWMNPCGMDDSLREG